jgi:hypothetical protein
MASAFPGTLIRDKTRNDRKEVVMSVIKRMPHFGGKT